MQHTELEVNGLEWSIRQIKAAVAPGQAIHCERQSGKTTALLEWVHDLVEKTPTRVGFVTHDWQTSHRIEAGYNLRWPQVEHRNSMLPHVPAVLFMPAHALERLRGLTREVVVDEWWLLREEDRRELARNWQVIAAVGTIRAYSAVPLY
jgi:hypothetical protein